MKRCTDCGIAKNLSSFGKQKDCRVVPARFYHRPQCKDCRTQDEKSRYQVETNEQKLKRRDRLYQRLYGIALNDYNELFAKQKGICKGCSKHQDEFDKLLVVDHCHTTNKVRGLLCPGCNLAIGNAKENRQTLFNLAKYLEESMTE